MLYKKILKPLFDFLFAFVLLIVLSPIFLAITIFLAFANNGKPFFVQTRGGKDQNVFNVIKFRTMNEKKDKNGDLLPDEKRITKVGTFVRKTSLDELPQLLNVLKGDMSLVGPRPFLSEYLKIYNDHQKKRHDVRPGITGWAQVNGRNVLTYNEKIEFDIWYVNHLNLLLDIKILYLTFLNTIRAKNISKEGEIIGEKFNGKN